MLLFAGESRTSAASPGESVGTGPKGQAQSSRIAERQLGSKAKWEQIRDLNTDTLDDEDTLTVGQRLKMPTK